MKRIFGIAILACISIELPAQQKQGYAFPPSYKSRSKGTTVIGHAQLEVIYALNATDINDQQTYIDLHVLRAGEQVSKHYSRFLELNDSLCDDFNRKNPHALSRPWVTYLRTIGRRGDIWSEYQYTEIFTENGQQTFYAWMPRYLEKYNGYYTEPACQQKWTLHADQKTIIGYQCQRATCHWRGRDFEAWFTPEIPIRLGPWSFGGLPGLILKINDTEGLYTWEAVGLRSGKFPVTKNAYEGFHSSSRDKIHKLQIAINRDYLKTSGAVDRKTGMRSSKETPYQPLEKE